MVSSGHFDASGRVKKMRSSSRDTVDEEKKTHHVTPDLSYCWGKAREQCEDNKPKWDGKK